MMTHCADPHGAPELLRLRDDMRAWRFYDHLRTDREAPARRPQVGTYTPVLGKATAATSRPRCRPSGRSATLRRSTQPSRTPSRAPL